MESKTALVTRSEEPKAAAVRLYGEADELAQMCQVVRKVAPWANDKERPMTDTKVQLCIRRAVAMGLDPLNTHEVQIWKDHRGGINFQLAYSLTAQWVRYFKGEHTEPKYVRLVGDQLTEQGLQQADVGYRVTFMMKADIPHLHELIAAGFDPREARSMLEVVGVGTATAAEYNGQYFAPNGRSKTWKVQKRALADAYRRKFGTAKRFEIEELRRVGGFDNLKAEDWDGPVMIDDQDALALAKEQAARREHQEALEADPELARVEVKNRQDAMAALFDGPVVEGEIVTTPPDQPTEQPKPATETPQDQFDAVTLAVCKASNGKPFLKFVAANGHNAPWWNGRAALHKAAPWIDLTDEQLAAVGQEYAMPVGTVALTAVNEKGYLNVTGFTRVIVAGAAVAEHAADLMGKVEELGIDLAPMPDDEAQLETWVALAEAAIKSALSDGGTVDF